MDVEAALLDGSKVATFDRTSEWPVSDTSVASAVGQGEKLATPHDSDASARVA